MKKTRMTQERKDFIIAHSETMTIRQMSDIINIEAPKIRTFIYLHFLPSLREDGKIVKRERKKGDRNSEIFNVNQYEDWITGGVPRRIYTPRELRGELL